MGILLCVFVLGECVCGRIEILRIRVTQEANNESADAYGVDTTKTWLQVVLTF
jgi:hypothetical protein